MKLIDLKRIREALPKEAIVKLVKYNGSQIGKGSPAIECILPENSTRLSEKDFDTCKQWQREIMGEALSEFYTEETGRHWFVCLKPIPIAFRNEEDIHEVSLTQTHFNNMHNEITDLRKDLSMVSGILSELLSQREDLFGGSGYDEVKNKLNDIASKKPIN